MKVSSAVLLVLLLFSLSQAQQRWERNYGGAGNDQGWSVEQTSDGGYIVAGRSDSFGDSIQVYLVKTNASGDTLWTRTYGGVGNDYGNSVQQTQDGGYIVAGWTTSFGNSEQVYLLKTNASGDTLWTRAFGGASTDVGFSVQQTSDGGYIVAAWSLSFGNVGQVYLTKTTASGDSLWTRTYGGTNDDGGYSVQQTLDNGYIVTGYTLSFGNVVQVYLIKTNSGGDTLWTRNFGGAGNEFGYCVRQTSDTGYVVAGNTNSFGNGNQAYLIKTNASGDTLWTRTNGGTGSEGASSVRQTSDLGFIVAGNTSSFGNGDQVYLVRANASGDTLWTRTFGGAGSDYGYSVQQTQDGGFAVAGWTSSFGNSQQVYLVKTDANGNVGVEEKAVSSPVSRFPFSLRPNPFTSFATLPGHEADRFSLYDLSGRRVGTYKGDRIGEGLAPGVYFLRPERGEAEPLRIVKVR